MIFALGQCLLIRCRRRTSVSPCLSDNDYVGSYDEWTLRADGKISDDYLGQRQTFDQPITASHFVAKVVRGTGNTIWRVGLIWPFEVRVTTAYVA